jgi:hypothetical protein
MAQKMLEHRLIISPQELKLKLLFTAFSDRPNAQGLRLEKLFLLFSRIARHFHHARTYSIIRVMD